jgi:hypothetical protein
MLCGQAACCALAVTAAWRGCCNPESTPACDAECCQGHQQEVPAAATSSDGSSNRVLCLLDRPACCAKCPAATWAAPHRAPFPTQRVARSCGVWRVPPSGQRGTAHNLLACQGTCCTPGAGKCAVVNMGRQITQARTTSAQRLQPSCHLGIQRAAAGAARWLCAPEWFAAVFRQACPGCGHTGHRRVQAGMQRALPPAG